MDVFWDVKQPAKKWGNRCIKKTIQKQKHVLTHFRGVVFGMVVLDAKNETIGKPCSKPVGKSSNAASFVQYFSGELRVWLPNLSKLWKKIWTTCISLQASINLQPYDGPTSSWPTVAHGFDVRMQIPSYASAFWLNVDLKKKNIYIYIYDCRTH